MPIAVCSKCVHYHLYSQPQLFSSCGLQTPNVLKVKLEYDQQENERRLMEKQRFEAGHYFDYEPEFYAWCEFFTPIDDKLSTQINQLAIKEKKLEIVELAKESHKKGNKLLDLAKTGNTCERDAAIIELMENGRAAFDPVRDILSPIYALCAQMNPQGQCLFFEPKETGRKETIFARR